MRITRARLVVHAQHLPGLVLKEEGLLRQQVQVRPHKCLSSLLLLLVVRATQQQGRRGWLSKKKGGGVEVHLLALRLFVAAAAAVSEALLCRAEKDARSASRMGQAAAGEARRAVVVAVLPSNEEALRGGGTARALARRLFERAARVSLTAPPLWRGAKGSTDSAETACGTTTSSSSSSPSCGHHPPLGPSAHFYAAEYAFS
jgi:hypothetical protein